MTSTAGPIRISHSVGKTQPTVGNMILSEACAAARALGMKNAQDQWGEILDTCRLGHLHQRVTSRTAELHLAQCPRDEQRERPLLVAHQLLEGVVKTKPRLHADGDDIQRIRQRRLDGSASLTY